MLEDGIAHTPYCFLYGSPDYRDALWRMRRNRQGNILEMPFPKMTIIYPPDESDKSAFYHMVRCQDFYLFDMAKCSIAESGNALDEADLVVIFLSQDVTEIHNFFERFSSLIPKTIVIIVDYQQNNSSGYLFRKLKEKYGRKSYCSCY